MIENLSSSTIQRWLEMLILGIALYCIYRLYEEKNIKVNVFCLFVLIFDLLFMEKISDDLRILIGSIMFFIILIFLYYSYKEEGILKMPKEKEVLKRESELITEEKK